MTAIVSFLMAIVLVYASASAGDSTAWNWQDSIVPDVGFDLDAAQIVRVTSLAATGKGSLADAMAPSSVAAIRQAFSLYS